ncbi:MAG TPA: hypothetical protein VF006_18360 [Longimicrobium sp.]
MTDWIVQGELAQALTLGALADRALLVISRYMRENEISESGREVLQKLRAQLAESQIGTQAKSDGMICAASIEALTTSTHVRAALDRGQSVESTDIAGFVRTLDALATGEHPDRPALEALVGFVRDLGKQTLDRETQILSAFGSGSWI